MKKVCKYCGEMFEPTGKYCKLCDTCNTSAMKKLTLLRTEKRREQSLKLKSIK